VKALFLALTLASSTALAVEQPQKLYCAVDKKVAYFATFDSGDNDKAACSATAAMWEAFMRSQLPPEAKVKCWCTLTVQA